MVYQGLNSDFAGGSSSKRFVSTLASCQKHGQGTVVKTKQRDNKDACYPTALSFLMFIPYATLGSL